MADYDFRAMEFFQSSAASLNREGWRYKAARVLPVAIYVDAGEESQSIGELITAKISEIMDQRGYQPAYQWGPFAGSYFTTIFGSGKNIEDGRTFGERMEEIADDATAWIIDKPNWEKIGAKGVVEIIVAVGEIALLVHGTWVGVAVATVSVGRVAWDLLRVAKHAGEVTEGFKQLFGKDGNEPRRPEIKRDYPPNVALQRNIKMGKQLQFRKAAKGKS